jgi:HAD superfamily hydrolase (TIGR01549 family)
MNEQQLIHNRFVALLSRFFGKKIAIYGVGLNTKYIIENLEDPESIVCLIDAQKAGTRMYGYKVMAADEVVGLADIIIIVARTSYLHMLYQRVKHLEAHGVEIYNLDGKNLFDCFSEHRSDFEDLPYWSRSEEELKETIDRHTTISFDLFDTLLTRSVMRPHDVFDLVERAYADTFGQEISFVARRIETEYELNSECVPNYSQIYTKLEEKLGFPPEQMMWLSEKEKEIEMKLLIPRKCIVDIFQYAISKGKTVIIVSDMYFDSGFLSELLSYNGIPSEGVRIIVSNEHQATKESGEIFDILKRQYDDILHIGDNQKADIENAWEAGIDAYYVMSPADMLLNSPLYPLMSKVKTIEDSLTLGCFVSRVLNSPFALCKGNGKVTIARLDTLAEYFMPIMFGTLRWLVQTIGAKEDAVVLFMARDGYLMKRLYDVLKDKLLPDLPDSVYFLTSRDALSEKYAAWHDKYAAYWETLGLSDYRRIFVFETETKGTSISKFGDVFGDSIGKRVELVCINTFNISATFPYPKRIHSYLGDFSFYHLPYAFLEYYELLEILSAPNQTQFLHFDKKMRPVFVDDELENSKKWDKITLIQEQVIKSLRDAIESDKMWHMRDCGTDMADAVLGMIRSETAIVDEEIKRIFIFESHYEDIEQENWWERVVK